MARSLDSTFQNTLDDKVIYPLFLLDIEFGATTLYFHTGVGTLTYDGNDYLGTGNLASISELRESDDLTAHSMTLTLSGVPSSIISAVLNDTTFGNKAILKLALVDSNGVIIGVPDQVFSGLVDSADIEKTGREAAVSVLVQHELSDLERPRVRRWTPEDQRLDHPTDQFFNFVAELQNKDVKWKEQD
jgi:hypothetical protein